MATTSDKVIQQRFIMELLRFRVNGPAQHIKVALSLPPAQTGAALYHITTSDTPIITVKTQWPSGTARAVNGKQIVGLAERQMVQCLQSHSQPAPASVPRLRLPHLPCKIMACGGATF
ncbi:hypothetical protein [Aquitalea magnusonii]|uniref:hypothetical protein n=1 Tax=Aquitalea magnusonii TaxID=332411 RepID=UPI00187702EE|nr:hypothetical protein [Aquitalea magnusonii]